MSSRDQPGCLADDFVALHDQLRAVRVFYNPFSSEQSDGAVGIVANRQIVNKRVGPVRWQLLATVPVDEFVEFDAQTRQFKWGSHRAG